MNDLVRFEAQLPQSAADIRAHVNRIQEVMQAVMKKDVHYGVIPGTQKPSLWKPGAEVLCMTFHIAPSFFAEDLSTADSVRYRVSCKGTHQGSGVVMGEGIGECSSNEEKYKWRKASSRKEFDATAVDRRRVKYGYSKQDRREYEIQQVRTEPPDVANTILKMAGKRAHIAMTLNVLAASDIFTQDIEDLPKELQSEIEDEPRNKSQTKTNGTDPTQPYPAEQFTKNLPAWRALIEGGKKTAEQIIAIVASKGTLTAEQKAAITGKPAAPGNGAPAITFAQVKAKLVSAEDADLLSVAADLIAEVADPKQRAELSAFYKQRRAELAGQ